MRLLVFLFVVLALPSMSALAQEPVPCDSCAGYPEGAFMTSGGPELGGDVHKLSCQSGTWEDIDIADPCNGCAPSPGTICADGTVYAGDSPDGDVPMYTTPEDETSIHAWNSGDAFYTTTSATSTTDGDGNTSTIIATDASAMSGFQDHFAAVRCGDSSELNHTDWYLPAQEELDVLYTNRVAIGGFSGSYWSSTETATSTASGQDFSDGTEDSYSKDASINVRCIRK